MKLSSVCLSVSPINVPPHADNHIIMYQYISHKKIHITIHRLKGKSFQVYISETLDTHTHTHTHPFNGRQPVPVGGVA